MARMGGCMNIENGYVNNGEIYIQIGVRKQYNEKNNNGVMVEYVTEFSRNISDRDSYCIDSRGVDSFFYKFGDKLMECNRNIPYDRYISFDELDNGYIELFDFINGSVFIGREFIRLEPVITYLNNECKMNDKAYLCSDSKYIVLYAKDNVFLAKYICGRYEEYCIIDCRYITDGMYKFIGNVYDEYSDRGKVYLEIVNQVKEYIEKMNRARVKKK